MLYTDDSHCARWPSQWFPLGACRMVAVIQLRPQLLPSQASLGSASSLPSYLLRTCTVSQDLRGKKSGVLFQYHHLFFPSVYDEAPDLFLSFSSFASSQDYGFPSQHMSLYLHCHIQRIFPPVEVLTKLFGYNWVLKILLLTFHHPTFPSFVQNRNTSTLKIIPCFCIPNLVQPEVVACSWMLFECHFLCFHL